jgi:hypothetical protein
MAEHETTADIIAEARDKYTVHECNQCAWRKCCSEGFGSEKCGKFRESIFLKLGIEDGYFTQLLDRLEAAHRRDRGNAAKLRNALKTVKRYFDGYTVNVPELRRQVDAALAAPPRNCDRYSHDEALRVWASEEKNEHNGCFDEWLYEIAKEGDAK